MKKTTLAAASIFAATLSQLAWAGPAELPEEELFEYADVVADVEVVSLSCDGDPYTTEVFYETPYVAELRVNAVLKGQPGEMLTYRVTTSEAIDEGNLPGCTAPAYVLPEGWAGRVYLQAAGDLGYWIENPGGAVQDAELSSPGEAPRCTVIAPSTDPNEEASDPAEAPGSDAPSAASCAMSAADASSSAPSGWFALALAGAVLAASRRRTP